jgi:plastocyanin
MTTYRRRFTRLSIALALLSAAALAGLTVGGGRTAAAKQSARAAAPGVVPAPSEAVQQLHRRLTVTAIASARPGSYIPGSTVGRDVQHLRYRYGPFEIGPGQNPNLIDPGLPAPAGAGFITRFEPNLELADGTVPAANQLHLHHAVWLVNGNPVWFADAEKSVFAPPAGYGWPTASTDRWILNHMLHNLYPTHAKAYLTWDVDFVPAASPTGRKLRGIGTLWSDVRGGENYPVFDIPFRPRGSGRYTYPTDLRRTAASRYPDGMNSIVVPFNGTLVLAVGHLHPGGLWNSLSLTRGGRTTEIHRGAVRYYDPAGPVSWDMAMGVTRPDWKVAVRRGDTLTITATYDSRHAAWYESMGLMVVGIAPGDRTGIDPFSPNLDRRTRLTHGRLAENRGSGGAPTTLPIASTLPNGRAFRPGDGRSVSISDFFYFPGDLSRPAARNPPVVPAGAPLRFVNKDARLGIPHTITACRTPCSAAAGHGYPLANGPIPFDSGQLAFGPPRLTAFTNRSDWQTPATLPPGTYNYFCRVHPFMRGSFRVRPSTTAEIKSAARASGFGGRPASRASNVNARTTP